MFGNGVLGHKFLDELFNDFQFYKTYSRHSGDLYQHSIWVEQYLSLWLTGEAYRISGEFVKLGKIFSERDKLILSISGLLHDVGKAGDLDWLKLNPTKDNCVMSESYYMLDGYVWYFTKKDHDKLGFDLIMHDIGDKNFYKKGYAKVNGVSFDFKNLFKELNINESEQKIIAVLVGSHRFFEVHFFDESIGYESIIKHDLRNLT
jgi:hypothetical protein